MILAILLILAVAGVGAVAVVYLIVRASQKKSGPPQPFPIVSPTLLAQPQDLDQQLRTLAKLKEDGVITEEDFSAKKKALLGLLCRMRTHEPLFAVGTECTDYVHRHAQLEADGPETRTLILSPEPCSRPRCGLPVSPLHLTTISQRHPEPWPE